MNKLAIETLDSHVLVAKMYKDNVSKMWYAIGRTTAWDNEEIPPQEVETTTAIDSIIGFKKVAVAHLVRKMGDSEPTDSFTIEYKAQRWQIVSDADALAKGARYLYTETTFDINELPSGIYRQVGVYYGLIKNDTSSNKTALRPNEVEDAGILLHYDNRRSQRYDENIRIIEKSLMKF